MAKRQLKQTTTTTTTEHVEEVVLVQDESIENTIQEPVAQTPLSKVELLIQSKLKSSQNI